MKKAKSNYSRREFISTSAKGAAIISVAGIVNSCSEWKKNNPDKIPRRILGKTGKPVSILSFGGGSQFLKNENGVWEKTMEEALESGINLFDTSSDYEVVSRDGKAAMSSEERFGEILPAYREDVMITTKLNIGEPGSAKQTVERSLKRMKTDYIDILMIHAVNEKDSVAGIEQGIYREMIAMKNEGLTRYIGFSSMDSAERSRDLLENLDFDVAEMALNPTHYRNYAEVAFPVAKKHNVGVIAIKVVRDLVGKAASAKELLEFVWTENHVASALIGHYQLKILRENIKLAKEYGKSMQASVDRQLLEKRLASWSGPHALCWARPGYKDGGIIV